MKRARYFLMCCAVAATLTPGTDTAVRARPLPMIPQAGPISTSGSFYFSLGGVAAAWDAPRFRAFDTFELAPPFSRTGSLFSADQTIRGGGPALTIGVLLPWDLIGRRPRLELSASGFFGSAKTSVGASTAFYVIRSIDGSIGFPLIGLIAPFKGGTLETDTAQGAAILRLKTDFAVGPSVIITPQIGILGGARWTRYRFGYAIGFAPIPTLELPGFIKETIRSRHIGGQVGVDASWRVSSNLTLHGGATFALMHVQASLKGNDCQTGGFLLTGSPCDGSLYATSVQDTATTVAVKVGGSLGGTWSWGWGQVTVMVFYAWTNSVAGVRNPTALTVIAPSAAPATIGFGSSYMYGGVVMVTLPLN